MKKNSLLVLMAFIVMSCSSDDDNNPATFSIIGDWALTSFQSEGEPLQSYDCPDRIEITSSTYEFTEYFDFSDGNGCVIVPGQINSPESYTLNGSTFTVNDEGEVIVYEIIEITATTLRLQETYVEDGETFVDTEIYTRL